MLLQNRKLISCPHHLKLRTPYEVANKQGSHVEIKSPAGVCYKGNITHLQKYEENKSRETVASNSQDLKASEEEEQSVPTQQYVLRSRRNRQPERFKDYKLG